MDIVKFYLLNKEYYFKEDTLIFTALSDFDLKYRDVAQKNQFFIKMVRKYFPKFDKYTDDELIKGITVKELPKPTSFPKFNNENPFIIKFSGKVLKSPKITAIRWSGYMWEYQIEHIGHKHNFQPETNLQKLD